MGVLGLLVTGFPGAGASSVALVPDCLSIHLRSLQGVQGLTITIPSGQLGTHREETMGFCEGRQPGGAQEGATLPAQCPQRVAEEGRAPHTSCCLPNLPQVWARP